MERKIGAKAEGAFSQLPENEKEYPQNSIDDWLDRLNGGLSRLSQNKWARIAMIISLSALGASIDVSQADAAGLLGTETNDGDPNDGDPNGRNPSLYESYAFPTDWNGVGEGNPNWDVIGVGDSSLSIAYPDPDNVFLQLIEKQIPAKTVSETETKITYATEFGTLEIEKNKLKGSGLSIVYQLEDGNKTGKNLLLLEGADDGVTVVEIPTAELHLLEDDDYLRGQYDLHLTSQKNAREANSAFGDYDGKVVLVVPGDKLEALRHLNPYLNLEQNNLYDYRSQAVREKQIRILLPDGMVIEGVPLSLQFGEELIQQQLIDDMEPGTLIILQSGHQLTEQQLGELMSDNAYTPEHFAGLTVAAVNFVPTEMTQDRQILYVPVKDDNPNTLEQAAQLLLDSHQPRQIKNKITTQSASFGTITTFEISGDAFIHHDGKVILIPKLMLEDLGFSRWANLQEIDAEAMLGLLIRTKLTTLSTELNNQPRTATFDSYAYVPIDPSATEKDILLAYYQYADDNRLGVPTYIPDLNFKESYPELILNKNGTITVAWIEDKGGLHAVAMKNESDIIARQPSRLHLATFTSLQEAKQFANRMIPDGATSVRNLFLQEAYFQIALIDSNSFGPRDRYGVIELYKTDVSLPESSSDIHLDVLKNLGLTIIRPIDNGENTYLVTTKEGDMAVLVYDKNGKYILIDVIINGYHHGVADSIERAARLWRVYEGNDSSKPTGQTLIANDDSLRTFRAYYPYMNNDQDVQKAISLFMHTQFGLELEQANIIKENILNIQDLRGWFEINDRVYFLDTTSGSGFTVLEVESEEIKTLIRQHFTNLSEFQHFTNTTQDENKGPAIAAIKSWISSLLREQADGILLGNTQQDVSSEQELPRLKSPISLGPVIEMLIQNKLELTGSGQEFTQLGVYYEGGEKFITWYFNSDGEAIEISGNSKADILSQILEAAKNEDILVVMKNGDTRVPLKLGFNTGSDQFHIRMIGEDAEKMPEEIHEAMQTYFGDGEHRYVAHDYAPFIEVELRNGLLSYYKTKQIKVGDKVAYVPDGRELSEAGEKMFSWLGNTPLEYNLYGAREAEINEIVDRYKSDERMYLMVLNANNSPENAEVAQLQNNLKTLIGVNLSEIADGKFILNAYGDFIVYHKGENFYILRASFYKEEANVKYLTISNLDKIVNERMQTAEGNLMVAIYYQEN